MENNLPRRSERRVSLFRKGGFSVLSFFLFFVSISGTAFATSVGTNVSVDGTLTVAGASTLQGSVTVTDGDLLDLSAIQPTAGTNEGLQLPQSSSALGAPASGSGYLGWRTDSLQLQYYDGASWNTVATTTSSGAYSTHLLPSANNTFDLGANTGSAWRNVYSSGTAQFNILLALGNSSIGDSSNDTITVGGRFISSLLTGANGAYDLGGFNNAWGNVYSSGTAQFTNLITDGTVTLGDSTSDTVDVNARFASDLTPGVNNSFDLGGFGNAWNDVFASGTIRGSLGEIVNTAEATSTLIRATQVQFAPALHLDVRSPNYSSLGANAVLRLDTQTQSATTFNFISAVNTTTTAAQTVFRVNGAGQIFSDAGTTITSPADLAELTKTKGSFAEYPDGTVVTQSDEDEVAEVADSVNDRFLGVATDRGVFMGAGRWGQQYSECGCTIADFEEKNGVRRVSVSGYIKVRVNDENGPIRPGDPLGISNTPGEARKAGPRDVVIGMARAHFPPKEDQRPVGEGSPNSLVTEGDMDVSFDELEEQAEARTAREKVQKYHAASVHGLVETVIGNGAGLAATNLLQDQGIALDGEGNIVAGAGALLSGPLDVERLVVREMASFHGDIRVKGHAYWNEDTAGFAKFLPGATEVKVLFKDSYDVAPIITVTPRGDVGARWWTESENPAGFSLRLKEPQTEAVQFSWHALAVKAPILFVSDGTNGSTVEEYLWGNVNSESTPEEAREEAAPEESASEPAVNTNTSSGETPVADEASASEQPVPETSQPEEVSTSESESADQLAPESAEGAAAPSENLTVEPATEAASEPLTVENASSSEGGESAASEGGAAPTVTVEASAPAPEVSVEAAGSGGPDPETLPPFLAFTRA